MTKFSANLGFLWQEHSLSNAIHAAKKAGFDAVECHWPLNTPAQNVKAALDATGLEMISLNTARGNGEINEFGLCALPNKMDMARASVDQALTYAAEINTQNIHVMAGVTRSDDAHDTFIANLTYAAQSAAKNGQTILIEPLNAKDVPDYFLSSTDQAKQIIEQINAPNIKLMFDCYHVAMMGENICQQLTLLQSLIGHIQFASVPDRQRPDTGTVDYAQILKTISNLGFDLPIGAEYNPNGATELTLGWMAKFS